MSLKFGDKLSKDLFNGSRKGIIPLLACSFIVLAASIYLITKSHTKTAANVAAPTVEQPLEAIGALGRLEPQGEVIKVAAPSGIGGSRIAKMLVQEGDRVRQGQVLAILDSYERVLATLKQAQSLVKEQERNLAKVQAGAKSGDIKAQEGNMQAQAANVERLEAELKNAIVDQQRYQKLFQNGATSALQRDSFDLKVESLTQQLHQAQRQLNQAQGQLSSVIEVRPTDIRLAETQLESAIANVNVTQAELTLAEVRAPIAGQILKIHAKVGESVSMDKGVLDMGKTQQMYAVAEVYETDIGKVKIGQKATIASEVLDAPISGEVEHIALKIGKDDVLNSDPAAKVDARVVEVRIRLDESEKVTNLTNLQVTVKIQTF